MDRRVIAIDGPSGAGKSSVSKRVGKELGFLHVDSGALYRIMTWQCLVRGVDTSDPAAVAACAAAVEVECRPEHPHAGDQRARLARCHCQGGTRPHHGHPARHDAVRRPRG